MIQHETANWFLEFVYRDGLDHAKTILKERVRSGDRQIRMLLNAVGLFEQDAGGESRVEHLTENRTFRPAEVAGQLRLVIESRERTLLVGRLVQEVIESGLPVGTAIKTLSEGDPP